MLDNLLKDEEDTWGNKDLVLQKNIENNANGSCEQ